MRKYDGRPHRAVDLAAFEHDGGGVWARIDKGTPVDDSTGEMTSVPFDAAVHFPADRWWTCFWPIGLATELHLDVGVPWQRSEASIVTFDLDLDVVVVDGVMLVLDRDEFDRNRVLFAYPAQVVDRAEAAVTEVLHLLRTRAHPFDGSHLDALRRLGSGVRGWADE